MSATTTQKPIHGVETYVPNGSPLIGISIADMESRFEIRCDHIHNSPPEVDTRRAFPESGKLEPNMGVHVWGTSDKLKRFLEELNASPVDCCV